MNHDERGVGLAEVLIAIGLIAIVSAAATRLLAWSARAIWSTGASVSTHALAQERIEQLASLAWHVGDDGTSVSDETTNLAEQPATAGGRGLSASPAGTLESNVAGYVDFLDGEGRWVGTGALAPSSAMFVRRWAVRPYGPDSGNTLVIQVRVLPLAGASGSSASRVPGEALLATALTRLRR
jgi:hypothetical protein